MWNTTTWYPGSYAVRWNCKQRQTSLHTKYQLGFKTIQHHPTSPNWHTMSVNLPRAGRHFLPYASPCVFVVKWTNLDFSSASLFQSLPLLLMESCHHMYYLSLKKEYTLSVSTILTHNLIHYNHFERSRCYIDEQLMKHCGYLQEFSSYARCDSKPSLNLELYHWMSDMSKRFWSLLFSSCSGYCFHAPHFSEKLGSFRNHPS